MPGLSRSINWNDKNLDPLAMINCRVIMVTSDAVIPAPISYIKVFAVKKLAVGLLV